jgi:hypothetical protein
MKLFWHENTQIYLIKEVEQRCGRSIFGRVVVRQITFPKFLTNYLIIHLFKLPQIDYPFISVNSTLHDIDNL